MPRFRESMTGPRARLDLGRLGPERLETIGRILDQVWELPPGEVERALERLCADDPSLRAEIESILAADRDSGGFLTTPVLEHVPGLIAKDDGEGGEPEPALEGARIGPWRILRELGRGGMGRVYLAERADGQFEQKVAIKLLKRGLDSEEILARFIQERQILARLEHPNIARLVDGGITDQGLPWFALEYVEGIPISVFCERRALDLCATLALFQQACRAVQFAHRNLVVHRDLKPGNILVSDRGEVKLLDFGIAKLLDPLSSSKEGTIAALRMMTPRYAAPEQLRGDPPTTATDVYALGVVLYQLLTGAGPYRLTTGSEDETRRAILEQVPETPSGKLRRTPERVHRSDWPRLIRGDLDNIVLQALRKEPHERYPSAEALSEDLDRYLDGQPVRASGRRFAYVATKFAQRNRVAVAAAALVLLSLAGGLVATAWQARATARERDAARLEARKAEEIKNFVVGLFKVSDPEEARGRTITARELLDRGAERVTRELRGQLLVQAEMLDVLAEVYQNLGAYVDAGRMRERALAALEPLRPRADTLVANVLRSLGSSYMEQGDLARADSVLLESLAMQRRLRGEVHWQTAMALGELATLRLRQGRYAEGAALYEKLLVVDSLTVGMESREAAEDMANFGMLLASDARTQDALPHLERALAVQRRILGPSHLQTGMASLQYATALQAVGEFARAESLHLAALSIYRKQLGPNHPDVGYPLRHLGTIARLQGDLPKAIEYQREGLAIQARSLLPTNPELAAGHNDLGVSFYFAGQRDSALAHLWEAARIWTQAMAPTHRHLLTCRNNIGAVLRDLGRYEESEPILRDVMRLRERTLASDDLDLAGSYFHLGKLLALRGRASEARPLLDKALTIRTKQLGEDNPAVEQVKGTLASLPQTR
jgi:serine/threonine-protein kinase